MAGGAKTTAGPSAMGPAGQQVGPLPSHGVGRRGDLASVGGSAGVRAEQEAGDRVTSLRQNLLMGRWREYLVAKK